MYRKKLSRPPRTECQSLKRHPRRESQGRGARRLNRVNLVKVAELVIRKLQDWHVLRQYRRQSTPDTRLSVRCEFQQQCPQQNAGNPATPKEAAVFTGGTAVTGAFNVEISSAKKYGFLVSESGKLIVTDRARRAIAPQASGDRRNALRDAILAAPDISAVYNFYRGENLPDTNFLVNALTDRFKIPSDKVDEFISIFLDSIRSAELIDESGERARLLDIGRDESHRPSGGKVSRAQVSVGTTCFVVQPFALPYGTYYESVFKPAIEQAGLTPVRADADIFGTGKVIDQVWRGINQAKVLVAELTTKNPNVFYRLGLAHALRKPVILISSNEDDVPFDLRHIRVILYDRADPFWGQKLIDKVADNIRSAIADPEDAIFKVEEVTA